MRKLLNTLYVMTPESYLALDGETISIRREDQPEARVPLHNLEGIVTFGYTGASPALMGACAAAQHRAVFSDAERAVSGARVVGESHGNVVLRREQYRVCDDKEKSCLIARKLHIWESV